MIGAVAQLEKVEMFSTHIFDARPHLDIVRFARSSASAGTPLSI
jgi:hypothetical protein